MNKPTTFGDRNRFAIEVVSVAADREFGEVYIYISGERVSAGNPVYLSTFVGEIKGFGVSHQSRPPLNIATLGLTDQELFESLHRAMESGLIVGGFSPENVWNYHCLQNIDDAVDGWEIYVVDNDNAKKFLWRGRSTRTCPPEHLNKVMPELLSGSASRVFHQLN